MVVGRLPGNWPNAEDKLLLYSGSGNVLCSGHRGFDADARCQRIAAAAGHEALVSRARAEHLPSAASARAAYADPAQPLRQRLAAADSRITFPCTLFASPVEIERGCT